MRAQISHLKSFVFNLILSSLACACTTTEKGESSEILTETGSLAEVSYWQSQRTPWPTEATVWQKTFSNSTLIGMDRMYKLWDFNGDGRVDMAQRISLDGKVIGIAYDFDLDGEIDTVVGENPAGLLISSEK